MQTDKSVKSTGGCPIALHMIKCENELDRISIEHYKKLDMKEQESGEIDNADYQYTFMDCISDDYEKDLI